jgi:hypothetical protein
MRPSPLSSLCRPPLSSVTKTPPFRSLLPAFARFGGCHLFPSIVRYSLLRLVGCKDSLDQDSRSVQIAMFNCPHCLYSQIYATVPFIVLCRSRPLCRSFVVPRFDRPLGNFTSSIELLCDKVFERDGSAGRLRNIPISLNIPYACLHSPIRWQLHYVAILPSDQNRPVSGK